MQIVKYTGWSLEYIEEQPLELIQKMVTWAYRQEIKDRENILVPIQWHAGIKSKKSFSKANQALKKSLKKPLYNSDSEEKSKEMMEFIRSLNPQAFDQTIQNLTQSK